jgi:ABC-type sugar transport system ATPase subunit/ribose/xylose/arabinose/galactoside ABC-type transport system permease subunit
MRSDISQSARRMDVETIPPAVSNRGSVVAAVESISKTFSTTQVLTDVSFELRAGEVLALVGENGAGKSTCVRMLGGVHRPDTGSVVVDGRPVVLRSPLDARREGIAVVNQHPAMFADLSITENVYAGNPLRVHGMLDHARMRREVREYLELLGLDRDPSVPVGSLRTAQQQLVEVARALAAQARVVVLDEPTAALSTDEVQRLFGIVDLLRQRDVALLFVGHRLEEIFQVADEIAVLRDGHVVRTAPTSALTEREVVTAMVGRDLTDLYPERTPRIGEPVLTVDGLSTDTGLVGVGLTVHAGEIVGLAGLVGSGRTEVARALVGIDRLRDGVVHLGGSEFRPRSPNHALAHGVAYVSEDRGGQSLVGDFSILENATLPVIQKSTRWGFIRRRLQIALINGPLTSMNLRFRDYDQPVSELSGGNQQKVVLAKWLATEPRLLILDEPTQGIDVGAKAEVHRIIADLADQGLAILMISSDMPEVLGMSDRIVVMRRGRVAAELGGEATAESVGAAATGVGVAPSNTGVDGPQVAEREARDVKAAPAVAEPVHARTRAAHAAAAVRAVLSRRETGLVIVLVGMTMGISLANSRFFSGSNLTSVLGAGSLVAMVALGELLVVLTRNIDVSVGSTIGLAAFLFGTLLKDHPGLSPLAALAVSCLIGLACGLVNGLVVAYARVPSIVVTLGTMYIYRGLDSILANGKEIAPGDIPASAQSLADASFMGLPRVVWVAVAAFLIVGAFLRWSARGRDIYQTGSNPDGALVIGVPTKRRVLMAFAISGFLSGLAGALWALYYGIVDGNTAYGQEMTVIAAVVVGGVALRGGAGTVFGVALGTAALLVIQNALNLARVNSNDLQAFYGAAIILAATIDLLIARRRTRTEAVI